jgi:hypothetical protein
MQIHVVGDSSVGSVLAYGAGGRGSILSEVIFKPHFYIGFGSRNI